MINSDIDYITLFNGLNVKNPLRLKTRVWKGELDEGYVKDNFNVLIQLMYKLKSDILYLDDSAKLKYIEQLNLQPPEMPDFGQDTLEYKIIAQSHYQSQMYFYDFIGAYKKHLINKIEDDYNQQENLFMRKYLDNSKNKILPSVVAPIWYVGKNELNSFNSATSNFFPIYQTCNYIKITNKPDDSTIYGHIGRTDYTPPFHTELDPTLSYFIDYKQGEKMYFTFDYISLYQATHIEPDTYLLFILKRINPKTMKEEPGNQYSSNVTINGNGNFVTTGSGNAISIVNIIETGDVEKLKKCLSEIGIEHADIEEIAKIVQVEKPDASGTFGQKTRHWLSKMLQKSVKGAWNIGIEVASPILIDILKKYFGVS